MNLGIIGSGSVGGTLGRRWALAGHQVVFSSRQPDSAEMQALVARSGANARAGTLAEAVATSEVLLLATPWPATRAILESAGPLDGKILVDATNPLKPKLDGLELGTTTSAAEQVAAWAPGATVVKAFNTIGFNIMENPIFADARALLFYCGDDVSAKAKVHALAAELGFDPRDAGPLTQARLLEPFALLWITQAMAHGREFAFQMMRR
jgi:8-hydroxy-5-deazaflavin:NADPH oxidoreductase